MAVDIANETRKVGNALASVRIDQMIVNMAKGIAQGQFELDRKAIENLKVMGLPDTVTIGDEQLSMLEAGFVPSFYQFVDTILELKMEVKVRTEDNKSRSSKETKSASISASGKFMGFKTDVTAAYSKTIDTAHSQKYSQDLSAQSLLRTKLVPVPAPEPLMERITIILEDLRAKLEAKRKELEENPPEGKSLKDAIEEMKTNAMNEMIESLSIG
ncbi:MAG: hypothetical protein RIM99_10240 [Cyclobacteriaceae bacterium]